MDMAIGMMRHLHPGALVFGLFLAVLYGLEIKNSNVETFHLCSLEGYSADFKSDSGVDCAVECLAKQASSGCVAYQWDADTGNCRLREQLNVTETAKGSVSVVMDGLIVCVNDADCPGYAKCVNQGCAGLDVCIGCSGDDECPPDYTCVRQDNLGQCIADDCSTILTENPGLESGVYEILIGTKPTQVWCDMATDGGGWTVFLKRFDGSVDFYLYLADYEEGFGDVIGEHWLGLDNLHALTSSKAYQMRADMSDWEGATAYNLHASMVVSDESMNYTLTFGSFLGGNGGNGFLDLNDRQFTTRDADRDASPDNCAQSHRGAQWYASCSRLHPTAKYYEGGIYSPPDDGIQWRTWPEHNDFYYSMKSVEMKLRP